MWFSKVSLFAYVIQQSFTILSDRTLQCPFDRWRAKPQRFRILPRLDQASN